MLKSKLHNPIIAKNSYLENAVVEKVNLETEKLFSDLNSENPVIPEAGRIWYNTETGAFKFANVGIGGDGNYYIDEFLSKTDLRPQSILSKVDFKDDIKVLNIDGTTQLTIDSNNKSLKIENSVLVDITTDDIYSTVTTSIKVSDGTNDKIIVDNENNSLSINYNNIETNGQNIKFNTSSSIIVNNGITDKFIIDNINDSLTAVYETTTLNTTSTNISAENVDISVTNNLKLTDGTNNKIIVNNSGDSLEINYTEISITGNTTVNGNMVVTGDLTVGGQTTKVDIASEQLTIADNIIILNSNLTENDDPRLASAIVNDEDVDYNAGIAINRGSEGILNLIKWVESTDTSTPETLKEGVAKISIWNYEAETPGYELHQIIDAYTLGREVKDKSGTRWVGYDGEVGINYANMINSGATDEEASKYAFKLNAGKLDSAIDKIVQEIDAIKFNNINLARVGETSSTGTEFIITHNLGTVFVDVKIQREEEGNWYFDILPIQVIDENTIKVVTSEPTKIRYMITAVQGFQASNLIIN